MAAPPAPAPPGEGGRSVPTTESRFFFENNPLELVGGSFSAPELRGLPFGRFDFRLSAAASEVRVDLRVIPMRHFRTSFRTHRIAPRASPGRYRSVVGPPKTIPLFLGHGITAPVSLHRPDIRQVIRLRPAKSSVVRRVFAEQVAVVRRVESGIADPVGNAIMNR